MSRSSPNPLTAMICLRLPQAQKEILQKEYPTMGLSAIIRLLVENHIKSLAKVREGIEETLNAP